MSDSGALRFTVLGPLRFWRGDVELDAGPRQQRCLLMLLLAAADQPLGMGELAELIWEADPPTSAVNIIHKYVGALRRLFEPGLRSRDPGSYLLRHGSGYLLTTGSATVDLLVFRRRLAEAKACAGAGAWEQALGHYTAALRLVRGPAGGAVADSARAAAVFAGLDGQFFDATVAATEIAVKRGQPSEVLSALRLAATMDPLHEPVHAGLVTALAAAGQQAEALDAYRTIRERLSGELGIDPGSALREAQRRVLIPAPAVAQAEAPQPAQLPPDLALFTGRSAELAMLTGLVGGRRHSPLVVAMDGMGGVGKSTLAVHFAHQVSAAFPDGRLHLDLHGDRDEPETAGEALRSLLYALGVHAADVPDSVDARKGMYRSLTAAKRILVLLDNARDPAQVRPLLPNSPESTVLVTSRRPLLGLAAFDGAHLVHVDLPGLPEARELLDRRLAALPNRPVGGAADEMIELCGRLPLALAIVGARLAVRRHLSPDIVAAELRDGAHRLEALSAGAGEHDPRASFAWSYRQLSTGAARLFRFLSVALPAGVRLTACASLAGQDAARTRLELAELVEAALVTEHDDGRFTSHVLVRAYAQELFETTEPAAERSAALCRLLEFYLHSSYRAHVLVTPYRNPQPAPPMPGVVADEPASYDEAFAWFDARRTVLKEAVRVAADPRSGIRPWQLAIAMQQYLHGFGYFHDWEEVTRTALDAARRDGDEAGEGHALRSLAGARCYTGNYDDALEMLTAAQRIFERRDMCLEQALVHTNLQWVHQELDRHDEALAHGERALERYRALGDRQAVAKGLTFNGRSLTRLGRLAESSLALDEALGIHRHFDEPRMLVLEGATRRAVAANLAESGRMDDAVRELDRAADAAREHLPEKVDTLCELAELLITMGETERGRTVVHRIRSALAEFQDGGPESLRIRFTRIEERLEGGSCRRGGRSSPSMALWRPDSPVTLA
ncbi:DNA-binding SARP family transcriptional activator/tetratricopeptide (TPR) repeat protein [Actinoplanes lutulentus]|uniref:DNA-binding SARP family transcriptional activator n=1 Tax=Actinoplanes lutulentus TaxID=1287878 RepID=A0A327Z964_9ACTN|nr:BTAD domain-containing putative transcriptional regulator [Actinoplanes lutulentus]MBB2946661.1 DNA-binding SARP family transcriptional activator/tetratricopeptide (TPR) repeat protein [Actinoplanes lutulentus]RAK35555.1 DNA-binding SARP family transcriptional activator [Actinoplanes lutulentus]